MLLGFAFLIPPLVIYSTHHYITVLVQQHHSYLLSSMWSVDVSDILRLQIHHRVGSRGSSGSLLPSALLALVACVVLGAPVDARLYKVCWCLTSWHAAFRSFHSITSSQKRRGFGNRRANCRSTALPSLQQSVLQLPRHSASSTWCSVLRTPLAEPSSSAVD